MGEIKYTVRHSNGKSWAVDEWEHFGHLMCKNNTWYFPIREEAQAFKEKKEKED